MPVLAHSRGRVAKRCDLGALGMRTEVSPPGLEPHILYRAVGRTPRGLFTYQGYKVSFGTFYAIPLQQ